MEIINPSTMSKPSGYSHGVKATGSFLAVAGQVGWDAEGQIVGADFLSQFLQALENVVQVVREAGGEPQNLISLTIFVTSKEAYLDCLKSLGTGYRKIMGRHFPAMTLVEIAGLIEEGAQVEVQGLAVI